MKISYKKLVDDLQNGATISKNRSGVMAMLTNDKIIALEEEVLEKLLKDDIVRETGTTKNLTTGEVTIAYAAKS